MFRKMQMDNRLLEEKQALEILTRETWGILSVAGDGGYPYGVPVNYAFVDGKILFHSTAGSSHKLDAIRRSPKVCFTAVSRAELIREAYTVNFESVIIFGTARIITGFEEKTAAMGKMLDVLAPGTKEQALAGCGMTNYCMVEITPEHITGKKHQRK